jgi:hypothetical protein
MGLNQGNWGAFLQGGISGAEKEQQMEGTDLKNRYMKDELVDPAARVNQADTDNYNTANKKLGYAPWQSQGMLFDPVRAGLHDVWTATKKKLSSFLPGQDQHAMGPAAQATVPGQANVAASPPGPDTSGAAQPGLPGAGAIPRSDGSQGYFSDGGPIPPRNAGALRARKPKPGNQAKPTKAARAAMNPQLEQPVSSPRNTEPSPSNQDPMLADGGHFIQGAIKHPGALHEDLGVPQGQKIPKAKLDAAAHSKGKVGRRARFAETLSKFSNGGQVDKPQPFKSPAAPKPQPNSLEKDVNNDGQRNRLGKTIKRFADGGENDKPASGLEPAESADGKWPGVLRASEAAGNWLLNKVGKPIEDYTNRVYAPTGALVEKYLTGDEHGLEPRPDAAAPKGAAPVPTAAPKGAAPEQQGPPAPYEDDPSIIEHAASQSPGGMVTTAPDGTPITPYNRQAMIDSLRGTGTGQGGGAVPPRGAAPEQQGPPVPGGSQAPIDFSQVQMDHQDIPNTSSQEWDQMKNSIIHSATAHGIPMGQAAMMADDQVSKFQHENFIQYMQQGIALDRAGNKQGAMAALKTAYNYMPTGHGMHFGLDPKTGDIIGVGFDEDHGKPVGVPVRLDQTNLNHLLSTYSDPKEFQKQTVEMMEQKRKNAGTFQGEIPLQRAQGAEAFQRGNYYEGLNQERIDAAKIRADAITAGRAQQDHSLAMTTALRNSGIMDPTSLAGASAIADHLMREKGYDQARAVAIATAMYGPNVDPLARATLARQYGLPLLD